MSKRPRKLIEPREGFLSLRWAILEAFPDQFRAAFGDAACLRAVLQFEQRAQDKTRRPNRSIVERKPLDPRLATRIGEVAIQLFGALGSIAMTSIWRDQPRDARSRGRKSRTLHDLHKQHEAGAKDLPPINGPRRNEWVGPFAKACQLAGLGTATTALLLQDVYMRQSGCHVPKHETIEAQIRAALN